MQQRSEEMARYEGDKIAFAKRLNEALEEKGLVERGRAGKLQSMLRDPPSRVAISKWLSGESLPEVKRLGEISRLIGRSVQWMLTGQDEEQEWTPSSDGIVPIIAWDDVSEFCNEDAEFDDSEIICHIPSPVQVGKRAFGVRVKGDSMISRDGGRSYPEGTVLIVDPDVEPSVGKKVVAIVGGETTFKDLVSDAGKWYLKPLNPQYKMLLVSEGVNCCGVVRCAILEE